MKRVTLLLGVLVMIFGIQVMPAAADGSVSHHGRGFGPPPEAYKACEGKTAGSTAQFTTPRGETITGTCVDRGGRLVLRPDRSRGNGPDGRQGPPPEAYKACEGLSAGSEAQFTGPRGHVVRGTCEEHNGRLVLRPDNPGQGRQGPGQEGPGN